MDAAIAGLRYGNVCVNTPAVMGFCLTKATWGAYPGGTPQARTHANADSSCTHGSPTLNYVVTCYVSGSCIGRDEGLECCYIRLSLAIRSACTHYHDHQVEAVFIVTRALCNSYRNFRWLVDVRIERIPLQFLSRHSLSERRLGCILPLRLFPSSVAVHL